MNGSGTIRLLRKLLKKDGFVFLQVISRKIIIFAASVSIGAYNGEHE